MSDAPYIDVSDQLRLLGTAHVATSSVEAVQHHIDAFAPEVVAVELCPTRYEALRSDRRLDREGLRRVMKEGKAPLVLLQAMLAAEQRKMGLDEGQQPGAELLAAVECAEARDLRVELVDRDIQTTLRRAWRRMRLRERVRLLWALLADDDEEEEDFDLDALLGDGDLLSDLMEELRTISPGAGEVLIDERDTYIAEKVRRLEGEGKTLVVVGAGHLKGIAAHLEADRSSDTDLAPLDALPQTTMLRRSVPWILPLAVFGLVVWNVINGSAEALIELFTIWTAANAVLAALGCLVARGHPIAVLTAALASPITSLNPTLAAGWFAGYVQLRVVEPSAEDLTQFLKLERISDFWTNKAGRVLLVTALSNLGSMLGAWVAAGTYAGWITL
ncbi:MAG: TraB/GumN family protein [Candidatus Thermoplasmatota archaeon]|nr:TraB/GumN family protein [Candidatus Thermoplasmatota archaeon]